MPVSEVARNVFLVPLPLPFALNSVNCYLLRDDDGWSVVDTGLHTEAGEAAWRAAFDLLGVEPTAIRQIVLTHFHPDHFGMAGWLQRLCGAPVLLAAREIELAQAMWGKPDDVLDPMVPHYLRYGTRPHPALTALPAGASLELGGRRLTTIHAPGHSDGQLVLYDADDGLALCGDHVLNKITPHIGLWPESEPDPLGRYLASLAELAALDVRLALPGHKTLITDWAGRIGELARHHDERLAAMVAATGAGATAYEVARRVFPFDRYTPHEIRFAVAETIAHLELLVARGELLRDGGEVVRYERV